MRSLVRIAATLRFAHFVLLAASLRQGQPSSSLLHFLFRPLHGPNRIKLALSRRSPADPKDAKLAVRVSAFLAPPPPVPSLHYIAAGWEFFRRGFPPPCALRFVRGTPILSVHIFTHQLLGLCLDPAIAGERQRLHSVIHSAMAPTEPLLPGDLAPDAQTGNAGRHGALSSSSSSSFSRRRSPSAAGMLAGPVSQSPLLSEVAGTAEPAAPAATAGGVRARLGLGGVARRTLGITLLLVVVFLWTLSNFMASVSLRQRQRRLSAGTST